MEFPEPDLSGRGAELQEYAEESVDEKEDHTKPASEHLETSFFPSIEKRSKTGDPPGRDVDGDGDVVVGADEDDDVHGGGNKAATVGEEKSVTEAPGTTAITAERANGAKEAQAVSCARQHEPVRPEATPSGPAADDMSRASGGASEVDIDANIKLKGSPVKDLAFEHEVNSDENQQAFRPRDLVEGEYQQVQRSAELAGDDEKRVEETSEDGKLGALPTPQQGYLSAPRQVLAFLATPTCARQR